MAIASGRGDHPWVGRAEVLGEARRYLREVHGKRAPVLLLLGSTGVGKSTFVQELVREEAEHGVQVLEGRALPMELPQPFFVLQEALRNLPAVRKQASLSGRGLGDVGVAGLAALRPSDRGGRSLVPLGMLPFESETETESPERREGRLLEALSGEQTSVEESRIELFDGLTSLLEDVAAETPLLLVLEDLHHADEGSLEFISFLARRIREVSLKVLATSLPENELPPRIRVHVDALAKEGLLRRLNLRPLTEAEATEFVHLLTPGRKVPEALVTKWHTLTEGNPLFLEQLVRGELLAAAAPSRPAPEATAKELPRGEELRQVLKQRLREMSEGERRALSYASVLEKEFSFSMILRASGEEEEHLAEALESLVRRGLLREKSGERFEFVHEELRGEVYMTLTEVRRGILHRKVAETLEKELPKEGPADPHLIYELARHWYIAQVDDRSLEFNLRAAELAKRALAPQTAAYHLERALESHRRVRPQDRAGEIALAIDLAVQLDTVGEVPNAAKVLEDLLAQAHRSREGVAPRDRARIAVHLAKIFTHGGEMQRAFPLTQEALDALGPDGDPQWIGHAHRLRGTVEFYRGAYAAADQEYQEARDFFEKAHAPLEVARSKVSLANVRSIVHPESTVAEIETLYREAIEELASRSDPSEASLAANNLALLYMDRVGIPEAVREMSEALAFAEKGKNPRILGWCEFNMADLRIREGSLDAAQEMNERAKQHLQRVGDRIGLIQVSMNEGRLHQARGDLPHAELALLESYRQARELGLEPDELEVILRLAELSVVRGELEPARQKVEELEHRSFRSIRPEMVSELDRVRATLKAKGVDLPDPPKGRHRHEKKADAVPPREDDPAPAVDKGA